VPALRLPLERRDAVTKPTYRVPSMAEIRALPPNGLTAISTFSGCGGSSLGYKMAGYRVAWASEFIPAAQETYRANHPGTILDGRDIRQVKPSDILDAIGLAPGDLDVFDGSPPCSSFSSAGSREDGWGKAKKYSDTVQRTDDLFWEYVRLIEGVKPRAIVAENVTGLVRGTAKGYFLEILARLKQAGYDVKCKVLGAEWLGVPQARHRTIFVGIRKDLALAPPFPRPLPYQYTLRDALAGLPTGVTDPEVDIRRFAIGREWERMRRPGTQSEKYFQLVRPSLDEPCPTITQTAGNVGAAGVCHPTEPRKFTIPELRRICGFPDDFVLTGSFSQQWERLGRAVPPPMMMHIAAAIRAQLQRQQ
jgi:DNA (cytosine-5)-methyltransferase 1